MLQLRKLGKLFQTNLLRDVALINMQITRGGKAHVANGSHLRRGITCSMALASSAMLFTTTLADGAPQKESQPAKTSLIRVVLTGGPYGGKTAVMDYIKQAASDEGYDVFVVPRCSNMMIANGCGKDLSDAAFRTEFNVSVIQLQLQMERITTRIAETMGRPSIVVCDRGLMDNKIYLSEDKWNEVLNFVDAKDPTVHFTEAYALASYDVVIHLVTSADGAEHDFKTTKPIGDGTFVRRNTPETAIQTDQSLKKCWAAHPNQIIIPATDTFREKCVNVVAAVLNTAKEKEMTRGLK